MDVVTYVLAKNWSKKYTDEQISLAPATLKAKWNDSLPADLSEVLAMKVYATDDQAGMEGGHIQIDIFTPGGLTGGNTYSGIGFSADNTNQSFGKMSVTLNSSGEPSTVTGTISGNWDDISAKYLY